MQMIIPAQSIAQQASAQQAKWPERAAKSGEYESFGAQLGQAQERAKDAPKGEPQAVDERRTTKGEEPQQPQQAPDEMDEEPMAAIVAMMIPTHVVLQPEADAQPQEAVADIAGIADILPIAAPEEGLPLDTLASVPVQAEAPIPAQGAPQTPELDAASILVQGAIPDQLGAPQGGDQATIVADDPGQIETNQGIDILERPAQKAEASSPPAAQFAEQTVMDDTLAQAQAALDAEDALARMPIEIPIDSWELERQGGVTPAGDPSSLENVDAEETTSVAPPSRVEITQIVPKGQQAGEGQADAQDASGESIPLKESSLPPVTEARFAPQMAEATPDIPQTPGTQIVEEAQIQQAMGRSQFTMRLNPESLGQVTVRLTMIGDQLTARIITRTEAAREALATELTTLGDAMRDKGVNVRQVQVIDSSMGQASLLHDGEQRGGQWQQGRRQRHVVVPTVDATEAVAGMELPTLDVATDDVGGVEIRA